MIFSSDEGSYPISQKRNYLTSLKLNFYRRILNQSHLKPTNALNIPCRRPTRARRWPSDTQFLSLIRLATVSVNIFSQSLLWYDITKEITKKVIICKRILNQSHLKQTDSFKMPWCWPRARHWPSGTDVVHTLASRAFEKIDQTSVQDRAVGSSENLGWQVAMCRE